MKVSLLLPLSADGPFSQTLSLNGDTASLLHPHQHHKDSRKTGANRVRKFLLTGEIGNRPTGIPSWEKTLNQQRQTKDV